MLQAFQIAKSILFYGLDVIGNYGGFTSGEQGAVLPTDKAIPFRCVRKTCIFRHGYFNEAVASLEYARAYLFEVGRQRDFCKGRTISESVGIQGFQIIGQAYPFQIFAVRKRSGSDFFDGIGKHDACQLFTILKTLHAYLDDGFSLNDGRDQQFSALRTIERNYFIRLAVVYRLHFQPRDGGNSVFQHFRRLRIQIIFKISVGRHLYIKGFIRRRKHKDIQIVCLRFVFVIVNFHKVGGGAVYFVPSQNSFVRYLQSGGGGQGRRLAVRAGRYPQGAEDGA